MGLYAAGQIAYFSHRYAHDMLGLNDAHISKLKPKEFGRGPAGHEKYDVLYTLETVLPDFLVQPHLIPGMTQHKTFVQQYMPLPGWRDIWVQREYWRQNSPYRSIRR